MTELLQTFAEIFMTGIVTGLVIVGLARIGLIPILLYKQVEEEDDK